MTIDLMHHLSYCIGSYCIAPSTHCRSIISIIVTFISRRLASPPPPTLIDLCTTCTILSPYSHSSSSIATINFLIVDLSTYTIRLAIVIYQRDDKFYRGIIWIVLSVSVIDRYNIYRTFYHHNIILCMPPISYLNIVRSHPYVYNNVNALMFYLYY